jgi:hypothetical protein
MKKSKIQIEYDESMRKQRVEETNGTGSRRVRTMKMVEVKDPKCWEVITVENSMTFSPGYRLNEKQVKMMCTSVKYDVEIGLPGQFRVTNSRY